MGNSRVFVTKQLDKPVYKLLQALRVAHGDASQWEILQAALVGWAQQTKDQREGHLGTVRRAPTDQPQEYEVSR